MIDIGRLLRLASLLEENAKNPNGVKFDISIWADKGYKDFFTQDCGTSACAMGLAVISGIFRNEGLNAYSTFSCRPAFVTPDGTRLVGLAATQAFFGLSKIETWYLFSSLGYDPFGHPTTKAEGELLVAKRIRDLCAGFSIPRGIEKFLLSRETPEGFQG